MLRCNLFSFVFIIGLINAMIRPMRTDVMEFGFIESLMNGFGISFIVWFAIYCSLNLLSKATKEKVNRNDWIMALLTVVFLAIPSAFISWLALSFFAAYCGFFVFKSGSAARNASLIMLVIALRVPISDMFLKLSSTFLLQLDAAATLSLLSIIEPTAVREGNIIIGANGHELLIMTGCASFTNISLALLLWFTILRIHIMRWRSALALYMIPLVVLIMGINITRLSMMALSHENYVFYHEGLGVDLINMLILLVAILIPFGAIYIENRRLKGAGYVA